jgi:hypothetical protein
MIRKLLAVAAVVAAFASVQGVASADPAPQKELCKNGGYADYVDPTTNLPFKNQGRCVSFVNAGGALVPVQEEPPVPTETIANFQVQAIPYGPLAPGRCVTTVSYRGEPGVGHSFRLLSEADQWDGAYDPMWPDATGLTSYTNTYAEGSMVTVWVDGQVKYGPASLECP